MYPVTALATICAGGVYCAIGANIAPCDAAYQFKLVLPKVVVTSEKLYDATRETCELVGVLTSKIYILKSKMHHDI
jgi:acyl-coenzyme A synthetase/AMP-(fatty) acid ligase